MSTIDGSDANPFPAPPPEWRPRELVRAEMAPIEAALRDRIARTARALGLTMADAGDLVRRELEGPVTP